LKGEEKDTLIEKNLEKIKKILVSFLEKRITFLVFKIISEYSTKLQKLFCLNFNVY
jgi:hypothetical protein